MNSKIIYDLGSNNGDDIPYYLQKADKVVAVEANPVLCDEIRSRFEAEIESGKLFLENYVVTTSGSAAPKVKFYISKGNHVESQFPKPINIHDFEEVTLPSKAILDLIREYGDPHYIKIDIEHYDAEILKDLFSNGVFPPYISAESHDAMVFALMVTCARYNAFKLVEGISVSEKYMNHDISVAKGTRKYSFPHHSAGPFGDDIDGEWLSAKDFIRVLGTQGLGWKDIHATTLVKPGDLRRRDIEPKIILGLVKEYVALLKGFISLRKNVIKTKND
jgi:FkbM family methyltransferase